MSMKKDGIQTRNRKLSVKGPPKKKKLLSPNAAAPNGMISAATAVASATENLLMASATENLLMSSPMGDVLSKTYSDFQKFIPPMQHQGSHFGSPNASFCLGGNSVAAYSSAMDGFGIGGGGHNGHNSHNNGHNGNEIDGSPTSIGSGSASFASGGPPFCASTGFNFIGALA